MPALDKFLEKNGIKHLKSVFHQNKIRYTEIGRLKDSDLDSLEIFGNDRFKLRRAIKNIRIFDYILSVPHFILIAMFFMTFYKVVQNGIDIVVIDAFDDFNRQAAYYFEKLGLTESNMETIYRSAKWIPLGGIIAGLAGVVKVVFNIGTISFFLKDQKEEEEFSSLSEIISPIFIIDIIYFIGLGLMIGYSFDFLELGKAMENIPDFKKADLISLNTKISGTWRFYLIFSMLVVGIEVLKWIRRR